MFQLICKDGHARRGTFTTPHGTVQTPVFMNVGTQAAIKGALSAEDLRDDRLSGRAVQYVSSARASGRRADPRPGRPAPVHDLGQTDPDRQRRIPDLLAGAAAEDHGGGRRLQLPCGRPGTSSWGRKKACVFRPISARILRWRLTSASKFRRHTITSKTPCDRTYRWLQRCKMALEEYTGRDDAVNPGQVLFGINQGDDFSAICASST